MASTEKIFQDGVTAYAAADANGMKNENNNAIEAAGVVLNTGDNDQTAQAMSIHAAGANYYTDSGIADAYVLTIAASVVAFVPLQTYFTGMLVRVNITNVNTGASTVNVSTIGVANIFNNGVALVGGELDGQVTLQYNGSEFDIILVSKGVFSTELPLGYLSGLQIENDTTDVVNDIVFNTGKCRDSTDSFSIDFAISLIKQIDVDFAVGTNGGGFPSGLTLTASTFYRCFVIAKADGTTDAGFDTSATAANLLADATDFVTFRQVAWIFFDSGSAILEFFQDGNRFTWNVQQNDFSSSSDDVLATLTVPPDLLAVYASRGGAANNLGTNQYNVKILETRQTNSAANSTNYDYTVGRSTLRSELGVSGGVFQKRVDSSRQVRMRSEGGANVNMSIDTQGFIDERGQ